MLYTSELLPLTWIVLSNSITFFPFIKLRSAPVSITNKRSFSLLRPTFNFKYTFLPSPVQRTVWTGKSGGCRSPNYLQSICSHQFRVLEFLRLPTDFRHMLFHSTIIRNGLLTSGRQNSVVHLDIILFYEVAFTRYVRILITIITFHTAQLHI
jgi:hypothetical protein